MRKKAAASGVHEGSPPNALTIVMLVAGHPILGAGVRSVLSKSPHVELLHVAGDAHSALAKAARKRPDVVVLDLPLNGTEGDVLLENLRDEHPEVAVVALLSVGDQSAFWTAVRAGALGFVLKEAPAHLMMKAIYAAHAGECWVQRELAAVLVGAVRRGIAQRHSAMHPDASRLTRRELQTLVLLAQGHETSEVAAKLEVSESTVRVHTMRMLRKLGLRNRLELVAYALREGLV